MSDNSHVGIEIERKYIIEMPEARLMESCAGYSKSEILQIYLTSPRGITHRIRKRVTDGKASFYETKKVRIDKCSSEELERELSEAEFFDLSKRRAEDSRPIKKVRHSFLYLGQLFEVDIYSEWSRTCILETELSSRDKWVIFPTFLRVVREVTGVKGYSNAAMSRAFPKEDGV